MTMDFPGGLHQSSYNFPGYCAPPWDGYFIRVASSADPYDWPYSDDGEEDDDDNGGALVIIIIVVVVVVVVIVVIVVVVVVIVIIIIRIIIIKTLEY